MAHEYRRTRIRGFEGRGDEFGQSVGEKEVRGKTEDAGEGIGGSKARENGDGAALGETAEDDARGRDAFVYFGFDEAVEVVSGLEDAWLVLGLGEIVEGDLVTLGDGLEGFGRGWMSCSLE